MSGPTIFGSNGKEQFTKENPAIVQLSVGADPTTGVLSVKIDSTDKQLPIQMQSRLANQIQTHNNTLVAPSTWSKGSWNDCSKFDKISVHVLNDASTSNQAYIYWSFDQSTEHGIEQIMGDSTSKSRTILTDRKAPYFKIGVLNGDSTTAHTFIIWTEMKA